jgi:hypothetical protein
MIGAGGAPALALQKLCTSAVRQRREIYKRPSNPGQQTLAA